MNSSLCQMLSRSLICSDVAVNDYVTITARDCVSLCSCSFRMNVRVVILTWWLVTSISSGFVLAHFALIPVGRRSAQEPLCPAVK